MNLESVKFLKATKWISSCAMSMIPPNSCELTFWPNPVRIEPLGML